MVVLVFTFILTWLWGSWLAFMLWRPAKWERFVDWENERMVSLGLMPSNWAPWFKRLEKGIVLKLLIGFTAGIGFVNVVLMLNRFRWFTG